MKLLTLLVGLILILEGLPYVAAPDGMRNWLKKLSETSAGKLRSMGLIAMTIGVAICYIAQKTSLFN